MSLFCRLDSGVVAQTGWGALGVGPKQDVTFGRAVGRRKLLITPMISRKVVEDEEGSKSLVVGHWLAGLLCHANIQYANFNVQALYC